MADIKGKVMTGGLLHASFDGKKNERINYGYATMCVRQGKVCHGKNGPGKYGPACTILP